MKDFYSYKIKHVKGSLGDTSWWTEEDWDNHAEYIKWLKNRGELGDVVEYTYHFKPFDMFDEKPIAPFTDMQLFIPEDAV